MTLVSNAVTVAVGAVAPPVTVPTLTLSVTTESAAGTDSHHGWQSVFLLNDGRIASFGTGNHNFEMTNAMRIIDPFTVTSYQDFEWNNTTGSYTTGTNRYVSHYDNHPSIYVPSDNKSIWFGHGVFDHNPAVKSWTYGNRTPNTQDESAYIDISAQPTFGGNYNPAVAWCSALDIGLLYGVDAGGSGSNSHTLTTVERKVGGPQPWKLVVKDMAPSMQNICDARNTAVCIGTDAYIGGPSATTGGDPDGSGTRKFYRVNLVTKTLTATLTSYPNAGGFPQMVYDSARNRIVLLGWRVYEYDPANDAGGWTDVTPSNYPTVAQNGGLMEHWKGVYHPTHNAIYFTFGGGYGATYQYKWHKLVFPASGASRWRAITTSTSASPFQGPPEYAYGGSKHVWLVQHPVNRRVYNFGGDYGSGAGALGQIDYGASFTTNEPTSPGTYNTESLCNDMYSLNPFGTNPLPWRMEHPYKVRNMGGGVREARPARPDQASMVWDPIRSKFWCFYCVLRTEFLYRKAGVPDLWANGSMSISPVEEPDATYSWLPGASGGPGTFTLETTNRLSYRVGSATTYNGGQLLSSIGDERIGLFNYDAKNDVFACSSSAGTGTLMLFTFHPITKTYEYRSIGMAGYNYIGSSCSYCAMVDGWLHAVAIVRTTGNVRTSVLLRINITAALAVANQGTIPSSAVELITLPWSLSTGNVWENSGSAAAKWEEHAGVIAVDRKVVIINSYDGIVRDGTTKMTIWNPDSRTFTASEAVPEATMYANAWCALDTGEVLMMMNTSGGVYSSVKGWAYRIR